VLPLPETTSSFIRGASPLGLPYTRSRSPLRRLAPFAWLIRWRSFASRRAAGGLLVQPPVQLDLSQDVRPVLLVDPARNLALADDVRRAAGEEQVRLADNRAGLAVQPRVRNEDGVIERRLAGVEYAPGEFGAVQDRAAAEIRVRGEGLDLLLLMALPQRDDDLLVGGRRLLGLLPRLQEGAEGALCRLVVAVQEGAASCMRSSLVVGGRPGAVRWSGRSGPRDRLDAPTSLRLQTEIPSAAELVHHRILPVNVRYSKDGGLT
jgi:hypothetical protein